MQISKFFLVFLTAAFCAVPLPLRAADADMQNKLQEALDKKLNELQTQPPAAASQPAVPTPKPKKKAAAVVAAAPAEAAAPVVPAATAPAAIPVVQLEPKPGLVAPQPADPEAIAKAREALRKKMADLQGQPASKSAPAPAAVAQPAPTASSTVQPTPAAAKPAPAAAVQATAMPAIVEPTPADPASIDKARAALHQKMEHVEAQPPKKQGKMQGALAFPTIQGPPPAVSAAKQERLTELLRRYKAEEITPEEYHVQRAKIMSAP